MQENRIARAAALIMVVTLAGRFFGFIREMLTARNFPVDQVDSYVVAYTLPNIFGVAMTGAFLAAFIPIFTQLLVDGEKERAWRLGSTVLNAVFLAFFVLVAIGMIFAPAVVQLIAPGFASDRMELTVELMRIMFPTLIFASVGGITAGILNSFNHFMLPSIGPTLASITAVGFIYFLAPSMGVYSLAFGVLVGLFFQLAVQIPAMPRNGFRYQLLMDLKEPLVREIGLLIVPVLIGVGIGQVNILIDRMLASGLPAGSISALNFANQIMQLPMGIFVQAISVPVFPALSALAANGDMAGLRRTMGKGTNYYTLVLVPMTVGLMVLSIPTVRIIFERGEFTAENTLATASALFWYSLGILPYAMRDLYTRLFYALQDTRTPVQVGAFCVAIHILLNLILIRFMAHGGLALATSIATALNMIILGWILWKRIGGWQVRQELAVLKKAAVASLIMGLIVFELNGYLSQHLSQIPHWGELLQLFVSVSAGAAVYAVLIWLLRVEEVRFVTAYIWEKFLTLRRTLGFDSNRS
ncbi:murein biosynthesis integral membrane protein MurJ [Heliobacillus mobilis]|uniref:Probable lipid II flippase MurJ n=1 Tax=Heliobacterium mobile TaxID=28064 RepID=A0A6I3SLS9_HELMO|nr:murein biosynthesis integral membrane protein MurJ [Heliobacterium mobile]MTV49908.1 murein biosynthesis integral membrane protein MurJ [Heliobacterium mobile]